MNKIKKAAKIAYIVLFIAILAVPSVAAIFRDNENIGNEEKVDLSNTGYLNFANTFDDYFSVSFGYRNELINLNNVLLYNVFGQSGEDSVIAGSDGWLFYESALHDYTGEDVFTDAELAKAVKILQMASDYVKAQGVDFVFVSAPNKMEIYGSHMPYYYIEDTDDGNYEMLMKALEGTTVNHADLKEVLQNAANTWDINIYHKYDSHWNNMGAAIAYEAIMKVTGYEHTAFSEEVYTIEKDFEGDLYTMLFPEGKELDDQIHFLYKNNFYYTTNFRSAEDIIIETVNEEKEGSVLLYRDSFGNALYSFFAEDFGNAVISRQIPYDFTSLENTNLVVVELVERNLKNLLLYPPIIPANEADIEITDDSEHRISASITKRGTMRQVTVETDAIPEDCTEVYIGISEGGNTVYYEAYPSAENANACIYLPEDELSGTSYVVSAVFMQDGKLVLAGHSSEIAF